MQQTKEVHSEQIYASESEVTTKIKPVSVHCKRNHSLDVLRGVAVLMVLLAHMPWPQDWASGRISGRLINLGSFGVDLFFVLSGFLISGLLFAEMGRSGQIDLSRFWLRRGLKIWPSYFAAYGLMLLLQCLIAVKAGGTTAVTDQLIKAIPNAVFLQNYIWPESRWFASWSLAVEEHFYLILPILLIVAKAFALKGKKLLIFFGGLCLVPLLLRIAYTWSGETDLKATLLYIQTHFRCDSLCFGVILGWLSHRRNVVIQKSPKLWPFLLIFLVAALAIPYFFPFGKGVTETVGLTILYLAFGGLVAVASERPDLGCSAVFPVRSSVQFLAWVGTYSYTIYLAQSVTHLSLGFGLIERQLSGLFGRKIYLTGILFIVGSIIGGIILSHVVERPVLGFRDKWLPRVRMEKKQRAIIASC